MPDRPNIVKPHDTTNNKLKLVVYSDAGVGKTTFSATAPKALILSVEAGLLSIAGNENVDVIEIKTWEDLQGAFDFVKNGKHDYETVVLDSLTETQKKHQDTLLAHSGHTRLSMQEWGDNIQAIRNLTRALRDLPLNVIITALAIEVTDESGSGQPLKRPALQGKSLPNEVMGFFDLVGYMVAQDTTDEEGNTITKRAIRFQPSETISAKDRSGKLDTWEKPDFSDILAKVYPTKVKVGK